MQGGGLILNSLSNQYGFLIMGRPDRVGSGNTLVLSLYLTAAVDNTLLFLDPLLYTVVIRHNCHVSTRMSPAVRGTLARAVWAADLDADFDVE